MIYLIGALKNARIVDVANILESYRYDVFADWFAPGPEADTKWQEYERARGRTYAQAIYGPHAKNAFAFDKRYLDECTAGVLVLPAGKSAHLELGYLAGRGTRTYVLFDGEPERFDLMYQFASGIAFSVDELVADLRASGISR